jgi:hypothetical protein
VASPFGTMMQPQARSKSSGRAAHDRGARAGHRRRAFGTALLRSARPDRVRSATAEATVAKRPFPNADGRRPARQSLLLEVAPAAGAHRRGDRAARLARRDDHLAALATIEVVDVPKEAARQGALEAGMPESVADFIVRMFGAAESRAALRTWSARASPAGAAGSRRARRRRPWRRPPRARGSAPGSRAGRAGRRRRARC